MVSILDSIHVEPATPKTGPKPRGGIKVSASNPKLKDVKNLLGTANLAIAFAGRDYVLETAEIDALAEAIYDVLQLHPALWAYIQFSGKLTVYGKLLAVVYGIAIVRVNRYSEKQNAASKDQSGSTRGNDRHNGLRENGTSPGVFAEPQMGDGN